MVTETGVTLDQPDVLRRRDPGGMLGHIARFPDQLKAGWTISRSLELGDLHRDAQNVAVLGMGGSAVCADLTRAIFSNRLRVPIVSARDYELPAWVGRQTLVVAISHSGATEETIAALSAALESRYPVVAITTGGAIGEVAKKVGLPRLIFPNETPPRASLGYTLGMFIGLLERAGMLAIDEAEVLVGAEAAKSVVDVCGPSAPTESNMAKQLAWSLLDRLPVIEGSGYLAAVARRWKTQLNENSKSAAVAEELPEATHNTVVGYERPDILHDHQYVVFLNSSSDQPRNEARAGISAELLGAVGVSHQKVTIPGAARFESACAAITLGDHVSAYLGFLYGQDPSSTPSLTLIKERMGAFGKEDDADS